MTANRATLGWGVALLTVGVLLLLRNVGAVPAGVSVWPWAVLAAGVALLLHTAGTSSRDLGLPIILVVVGGIFALRDVGVLPTGVGLAPIVLIALGLVLLAGGVSRNQEAESATASLPLDGATAAKVALAYGAGTLRVGGGGTPGLLYEGTFAGGIRQEADRRGDVVEVTVRHASGAPKLVGWRRPLDWDLRLSAAVPLDLEVRTGASRVHLDLADLHVRSLKISTGASDVDVIVPARGACRVEIEAGAADVSVRVPDGVAASVRTSSALASVDIDPVRFPRVDGAHRSPGFDAASDRAEIAIEGGLASFAVR
jgi:hypothetical protein